MIDRRRFEGGKRDGRHANAKKLATRRFGHALDRFAGHQIDHQGYSGARHMGQADDANAARLDHPGDRVRGGSQEAAVFTAYLNHVVGDEGRALADQAQCEIGFSTP